MSIQVLDQSTINKIAAGEVVERPASVVKELVENAMDAKANAITVEIKEGGLSFIRVTDNGCGINKDEIEIAFLRHSTSKIRSAADLLTISSLGFRGEALASISAVAQVELITKTPDELAGIRYEINGGEKKSLTEVGAPTGTTFVVRNLFYNTPARRKFLKSSNTEGAYISELIEHMALSRPDISFRLIVNNNTKLHTSGNNKLREVIYSIYGREVEKNLIEINEKSDLMTITGYIGKPVISRGNKNYMNYFINKRFIKSNVINVALCDAYAPYMMQHRYPFTAFHIDINQSDIDVNVHPTKMELRFSNNNEVKMFIYTTISQAVSGKNLIVDATIDDKKTTPTLEAKKETHVEPFEVKRKQSLPIINEEKAAYNSGIISEIKPDKKVPLTSKVLNTAALKENPIHETVNNKQFSVNTAASKTKADESIAHDNITKKECVTIVNQVKNERRIESLRESNNQVNSVNDNKNVAISEKKNENDFSKPLEAIKQPSKEGSVISACEQQNIFNLHEEFKASEKPRIIGQLFDTYWIVEYDAHMYIIDQHAAHEKVLYERFLKKFENSETLSQSILPPIIISLNMREEEALLSNMETFRKLGYEIEEFGGREYKITAVPAELYGMHDKDLLIEILDNLVNETGASSFDTIKDRIATMACKAAVKGNNRLSVNEATALIEELLLLDNPFNCPHGRPTIISMSKYEIEKKFKRII